MSGTFPNTVPALSCRGHLSRRHVTSCVTCHVSRGACPVSRAARNTLIIKRKQGSQEGTKPGIIPSHQAGKSIPSTLLYLLCDRPHANAFAAQ